MGGQEQIRDAGDLHLAWPLKLIDKVKPRYHCFGNFLNRANADAVDLAHRMAAIIPPCQNSTAPSFVYPNNNVRQKDTVHSGTRMAQSCPL